MAYTLILKDGGVIVPKSVFDVLDIVEETLGVDARQYLEDYLEDKECSFDTDDHYQTVLENIDYMVSGLQNLLQTKRLNREAVDERIAHLESLIHRELGEERR